MLATIKAILYERTVALCASVDFGKGLGRSDYQKVRRQTSSLAAYISL